MNKGIIYKITNTKTGQIYIGQTKETIERRFCRHLSKARFPQKYKSKLYRNMRKHGKNAFVIEHVKSVHIDKLDIVETKYIEMYNCCEDGLNTCSVGIYKNRRCQ